MNNGQQIGAKCSITFDILKKKKKKLSATINMVGLFLLDAVLS